ncbi:hypothetical protein PG991_010756 [Apiospora marii]|uniref:Uncharacterized protein n=1 Tax=Apiospora marii TaxID=335849 RepID=A0ABR1RCI1_9PEZI
MADRSKPHMSMRAEPVEYLSHLQTQDDTARQFSPGPGQYELLSKSHDDVSGAGANGARDDRPPSWTAWHLEIWSILGSIACMIGVVVILSRMKDQPLSNWTIILNLNSTIAVLITALKSWAMLAVASCLSQGKWMFFRKKRASLRQLDIFDDASRGPLGALRLFWALRRRLDFALIGAFVTVVVMGVDTFAQQLIRFESRVDPVDNNGTASFMVSDSYYGGARAGNGGMTPTAPTASTVDTAMQGAIYRGLYNTASSPPFKCSSQCQWNLTARSLGFTSHCEDVTTQAMATLNQTHFPNGTLFQTVTTPGNINLTYINGRTSFHPVAVVSAADITTKGYNQKTGEAYAPEFARIGVLRMRELRNETEEYYWYLGANVSEVVECTVKFTTFEYTDMRTAGSELAVRDTREVPLGRGYRYDEDHERRTWYAYFNQTDDMPANRTQDKAQFRIATPDMGALSEFFTSTRFSGSIYDGESALPSEGLGIAFMNGNIPAVFANMTQSMTDHLRSGYGTVQAVRGQTLVPVTVVRVYWVWLSLPIGVLALSTLFLGITIWDSWGCRSTLWKSSVVAALYHKVASGTGSGGVLFTDLQSVKQMEKISKETSLVYVGNEGRN